MSRAAAAVLVLGICCCLTGVIHAQSSNASVTGLVTDPSKAVIVGAKVTAINESTNVRYEGTTNSSGGYYVTGLLPGTYRVEIEKTGFKTVLKPSVILHVQDTIELNFEMALGSTTESVTVEGGVEPINTQNATVSTVVDRRFVENMPLNGRSFQTLIALAPGVVTTAASPSEMGQFSVNGQRPDANYFSIDGASANFGVTAGLALGQDAGGALPGFSAQGGTNSLVSVDAMLEFRIQTSSFAPEFGRTPGGQVSIQTRSGTNEFHGTLFNYLRNDALDANDWFSNHNHLRKPADRQNDFGGVFGGPIFRDRTFFFASYEGLRLRLPSTQTTSVPDKSARMNAPAGIQPFLNAYPIANGPELGNGFAQFAASYSNPSSLDAYSVRFDQLVNSSVSLFGRYNYSRSEVALRGALGVLSNIQDNTVRLHTLTLGSNQRLMSHINNDVRVNFSYMSTAQLLELDSIGGAVPFTDSIFPAGLQSPSSVFQFSVQSGVATLLLGRNAANGQRQLNFVDNLSLSVGTHTIKVGADYRWLSPFNGAAPYTQLVAFSGINGPTGVLSGNAQIAATFAQQNTAYVITNSSLYGQDTWKVLPRLTLTYGLRWEINPPLNGKSTASTPFTVTTLDPATMALAPRGAPLYQTTYGNVAPRFGITYQVSGAPGRELVVRGGVGTFYDLGTGSLAVFAGGFPFSALKFFLGVPFPLTPQQAAPPPFTTSPPVTSLLVADPNLALPRTYEWNVAVEQALGKSQSLSLTYVGSAGRELLRTDTLCFTSACGVSNPTFANGTVQVVRNTATSDYDALQIQFRRNLAHGLQALAGYTWSHSLDIGSTDSVAASSAATSAAFGNPSIDRGNSSFDVRHTMNVALTYDIPTVRETPWLRAFLGGWSIDSLFTARSAPPVDLASSTFVFIGGTRFKSRPNVVPGVPVYLTGSQFPGGIALNKAAFINPAAGQQGDLARNQLRLFGAWQDNFALRRQFKFGERFALQLRAEFFNIFNHPNFGNPTGTNLQIASPLFGQSTQTLASSLGSGGQAGGFSPLYQIGGPRSGQLALKLTF